MILQIALIGLCVLGVINSIWMLYLAHKLALARRELFLQTVRNQWLKRSLLHLGWACDEWEDEHVVGMGIRRLEGSGE